MKRLYLEAGLTLEKAVRAAARPARLWASVQKELPKSMQSPKANWNRRGPGGKPVRPRVRKARVSIR